MLVSSRISTFDCVFSVTLVSLFSLEATLVPSLRLFSLKALNELAVEFVELSNGMVDREDLLSSLWTSACCGGLLCEMLTTITFSALDGGEILVN